MPLLLDLRRTSRPRFALSLSLACLALSAGASLAAETPRQGGDITFGVTTDPICFNPHRSTQQNSYILIRNFIDSLVAKASGGRFLPWLAQSYAISADGKTYSFKLKPGLRFHDGTPLDAEAVKFNFDFVRDTKNTNAAGELLQAVDAVQVVSPTEVKLTLRRPDSGLLESIASVRLGLVSPKSLRSGDSLCAGGPTLAGSGPFVFDNYTRGQSATFLKNKDYQWAPGYAAHTGPAYLDKLTVRFLPEYAVRAGALSSGQVDVIEGVQPTDVGLFKGRPGFQFLVGPAGAQTSFTLNINYTIPPANDVRVRRALRDGANIGALVNSVYQGTYRRAWSNIGPDNYFYNKSLENAWGNDVTGANRLLDEAGWTGRDTEGFRTKDGQRLTIEVGYPQPFVRDNREVLIQGLQALLRKNLGFDLRLRFTTGGEWAQQLQKGTWTIYPNTYLPADAAQELQGNIGESGFIRAVADKGDKELFRLINEALASTNADAKKKLVEDAQRRAVDQAFIVPLFSANYQLAAKSGVRGLSFETQLDSPSNFHDVWLQGK
ncbi:ABC transporter substrate-binding protein [Variovorax ginsengisoli]|uniref:Peptide/nickel transport system substrate-binding protein n=1 Tax=Variovorax ginsengisoli TaxID=363844 RepID=A0ABT9S3D9_9BURK|nr:ABC transporter substrate-binding protein [Variovorax ginsengisoli]MDP9898745.1 peptide/nickel transport system substrate-binding protein [Variovorax ginsengisoli]